MLACLLGEQNGDWTLRFCKNRCFWHLFWAGVTNMGFNLAVRRLLQKKFVREQELYDEQSGEAYAGLAVAEPGWDWIDTNESQFVLTRPEKAESNIPF